MELSSVGYLKTFTYTVPHGCIHSDQTYMYMSIERSCQIYCLYIGNLYPVHCVVDKCLELGKSLNRIVLNNEMLFEMILLHQKEGVHKCHVSVVRGDPHCI